MQRNAFIRAVSHKLAPNRVWLVLAALLLIPLLALADEKLFGIACRSVHLGYPAEAGQSFYNEVVVKHSAPGSYFMVCGWNKGYFGIQESASGKKVVIFSVWDSAKENNPNAVAEDQRVKMLYKDEKVRVGRFGNEGTGGQSFFDYDWKIGETNRFMVHARTNSTRTQYSGYMFIPAENAWKHLVTFSTVTGGKPLSGYYSFVEDFKRDRVSATKARDALYGPGWVQTVKGDWQSLRKARFTGDSNPATNINAVVEGGRFLLATGGSTINADTKLRETLSLPALSMESPPTGLPTGFDPRKIAAPQP